MEDAMEPTRVRADNMSMPMSIPMPMPIVLATQHTDEEGTEERVISQHRTSGERRDDNFNVGAPLFLSQISPPLTRAFAFGRACLCLAVTEKDDVVTLRHRDHHHHHHHRHRCRHATSAGKCATRNVQRDSVTACNKSAPVLVTVYVIDHTGLHCCTVPYCTVNNGLPSALN